ARLSLFARGEARLAETARACAAAGASGVLVRACDIGRRKDVERAFVDFARAHGPLHAVVANAGIGGANRAGEGDRFEALVATNLLGTYHTLRAAEAQLASGPDTRHVVGASSILA